MPRYLRECWPQASTFQDPLPLVGRSKGWGYATSVLRHRFRDTHRDGLISNDLLTSGDRLLQRRAGAYLALLPLHSSIMDRRDERE